MKNIGLLSLYLAFSLLFNTLYGQSTKVELYLNNKIKTYAKRIRVNNDDILTFRIYHTGKNIKDSLYILSCSKSKQLMSDQGDRPKNRFGYVPNRKDTPKYIELSFKVSEYVFCKGKDFEIELKSTDSKTPNQEYKFYNIQ